MPTNPLDLEEIKGLMAEMVRIRADFEDFDGDRRGIAECLTSAEIRVAFALAGQGPTLIEQYERMREALRQARKLILSIEQRSAGWCVNDADPEVAVCDTLNAVESALNQQEETNGYR